MPDLGVLVDVPPGLDPPDQSVRSRLRSRAASFWSDTLRPCRHGGSPAARGAPASGPSAALSPMQQRVRAYALCVVAPEQARMAATAVTALRRRTRPGVDRHRDARVRTRDPPAGGHQRGRPHPREAVRIGQIDSLGRPLARARMTYAGLLAEVGKIGAALAQCDEAARQCAGWTPARLYAQRAMILTRRVATKKPSPTTAGRFRYCEQASRRSRSVPPLSERVECPRLRGSAPGSGT